MFKIYQVVNKINRKSYIGFTTRDVEIRLDEHNYAAITNAKQALPRAIRKYGVDNFSVGILEEGWDPKIGKDIREPYWISVLKPEYNQTAGGDGCLGYKWTKEYRRIKVREVTGNQNAKGKKHSMRQNQRQSEYMKKTPMRMFVCPHCCVTGNMVIKRYHFDRCKRLLTINGK